MCNVIGFRDIFQGSDENCRKLMHTTVFAQCFSPCGKYLTAANNFGQIAVYRLMPVWTLSSMYKPINGQVEPGLVKHWTLNSRVRVFSPFVIGIIYLHVYRCAHVCHWTAYMVCLHADIECTKHKLTVQCSWSTIFNSIKLLKNL